MHMHMHLASGCDRHVPLDAMWPRRGAGTAWRRTSCCCSCCCCRRYSARAHAYLGLSSPSSQPPHSSNTCQAARRRPVGGGWGACRWWLAVGVGHGQVCRSLGPGRGCVAGPRSRPQPPHSRCSIVGPSARRQPALGKPHLRPCGAMPCAAAQLPSTNAPPPRCPCAPAGCGWCNGVGLLQGRGEVWVARGR